MAQLQKIEIDSRTALEVAYHEAIVRQAYKDSGGVWTWSVGLTSATGHNVERYINNPQPLQKCVDIYIWALRNYSKAVLEAFQGYELTQEQFAGALSFHWNTGRIGNAAWVKLWKEGRMVEARRAFMSFNKPASIIGRRQKEAALFFDGKWSNDGTTTEYTRVGRSGTPVWKSAKKVYIKDAIEDALSVRIALMLDEVPRPDIRLEGEVTLSPPTPEASPVPVPVSVESDPLPQVVDKPAEIPYVAPGPWQRVVAWFKGLFS